MGETLVLKQILKQPKLLSCRAKLLTPVAPPVLPQLGLAAPNKDPPSGPGVDHLKYHTRCLHLLPTQVREHVRGYWG